MEQTTHNSHEPEEFTQAGDAAQEYLDTLTVVPDEEDTQISDNDTCLVVDSVRNIPVKYQKSHYDDIKDEPNAVKVAEAYGNKGSGWLFIFGSSGSGKTMLASIVARHVIKKHLLEITWINAVELTLELKATFSNRGTEADVIKKYSRPGLLLVDDLGAEIGADYAVSGIYMILNKRSENGYPTIITSNLSLQDIQANSVRVADRILRETVDGGIVKMENGSYHLRKKANIKESA